MQGRLAEQRSAREDATDALANQMFHQWVELLEEGIDCAYESTDPRSFVERHSNQLAVSSQGRYLNEYGDALKKAANRVVDHFQAQQFECWLTKCTTCDSITVSWDPTRSEVQNEV